MPHCLWSHFSARCHLLSVIDYNTLVGWRYVHVISGPNIARCSGYLREIRHRLWSNKDLSNFEFAAGVSWLGRRYCWYICAYTGMGIYVYPRKSHDEGNILWCFQ